MSFEFYDNEAGYASVAEISDDTLAKIRQKRIGKALLFALKD